MNKIYLTLLEEFKELRQTFELKDNEVIMLMLIKRMEEISNNLKYPNKWV